MIARFTSLKGLGVFLDYAHGADVPELRQLNLIYGFNGSGKTTLSRVLSSLGLGGLRSNLPAGGAFEVELAGGARLKSTGSLDALKGRLLVFNVDFVEENLKWKDGMANPVFYIGKPQADAAAKLEKAETDLRALIAAREVREAEAEKAQTELTKFKRDRAREIADATVSRNYAAPALVQDYGLRTYTEADQLPHDRMTALSGVVNRQAALPKQTPLAAPALNFGPLVSKSRVLLRTTLGELAVAELRQHAQMVPWVKQGLEYHTNHKVENCLFCGNAVSKERLDLLTGALDARLDRLNAEIATEKRAAIALRDRLLGLQALPSKNDVSTEFQADFSAAIERLKEQFVRASSAIEQVIALLGSKSATPSSKVDDGPMLTDAAAAELDSAAAMIATQINTIIACHNEDVEKFEQGKTAARTTIKNHHLATHQASYAHMVRVEKDKRDALNEASRNQAALVQQTEELQRDVRTHGKAETIINPLVQGYLGHKELTIKTLPAGYHILRQNKPISSSSSLSEGEKTALALCYFLATLEAEDRKKKDLVVVVDDPISSLDTRALHHAFGLIKSALHGSGQLIIMTHNLHFMNEVKKWLKKGADPKGKTPTTALLYIEAKQDPVAGTRSARIMKMPRIIREYESEYQLLFNLTLRLIAGEQGLHYLMPNALRKILEIFLAFKQPGNSGLDEKIKLMTGELKTFPEEKIIALQRLVHLESHADSLDDLVSLSSMTIEATQQAAEALVELMKAADLTHYERLAYVCRIEESEAPTAA